MKVVSQSQGDDDFETTSYLALLQEMLTLITKCTYHHHPLSSSWPMILSGRLLECPRGPQGSTVGRLAGKVAVFAIDMASWLKMAAVPNIVIINIA